MKIILLFVSYILYHFIFRYKGGPALPRKLISQGDVNKQFNVEVYPLCLKLIDSRDQSQTVIRFSKKVIFYP